MVGDRPHFTTWHGILGTVIWILVWIQYFSGWLRPPAKIDGILYNAIITIILLFLVFQFANTGFNLLIVYVLTTIIH